MTIQYLFLRSMPISAPVLLISLFKVKEHPKLDAHSIVGVPGLEPGKAGPESAVLPLHHTPIILIASAKVRTFFETTKFFADFFLKITNKSRKEPFFTLFAVTLQR